jgi:hypothetical protein
MQTNAAKATSVTIKVRVIVAVPNGPAQAGRAYDVQM